MEPLPLTAELVRTACLAVLFASCIWIWTGVPPGTVAAFSGVWMLVGCGLAIGIPPLLRRTQGVGIWALITALTMVAVSIGTSAAFGFLGVAEGPAVVLSSAVAGLMAALGVPWSLWMAVGRPPLERVLQVGRQRRLQLRR